MAEPPHHPNNLFLIFNNYNEGDYGILKNKYWGVMGTKTESGM